MPCLSLSVSLLARSPGEELSPPPLRRALVCGAYLALTTAVTLCVTDLGLVFTVVGATGDMTLGYLLPSIVFLRLVPEGGAAARASAMAMCAFGLFVLVVAMRSIFLGDVI